MELSQLILDQLLQSAKQAHPEECCGLLLGHDEEITRLVKARNVHPDPRTHFEIDPATLITAYKAERGGGLSVIGYYHSHPHGPPVPSATDAAMAARDSRLWAIVGHGEITFWRDTEDGFEPISYRAVPA